MRRTIDLQKTKEPTASSISGWSVDLLLPVPLSHCKVGLRSNLELRFTIGEGNILCSQGSFVYCTSIMGSFLVQGNTGMLDAFCKLLPIFC